MPGEIEERTKEQRLREGIDVDETTWSAMVETARLVGLTEERIEELLGGARP
jgi:LDH2 family malate/lactate/ureidoglycolate dehydrogenase